MLRIFLCLLFIVTIGNVLLAGVSGKIAGVVKDKASGEPLAGVNLILEGTRMGASSDESGYYVILNVPPGTYSLNALYMGYTDVKVENVNVNVDLTTRVNIEMSETTFEAAEEITVIAERPLVRNDEVASRHFVSSDEIEIQPIDNFQEIAQNQPGVIGSHFRGGRSGEVLILVDGIPVRDPASGYSGNLGGFTSDVPEFSIQEMEVSLSGFSAEYGNVQSGIINLAVKEGSEQFTGRLRFTSLPGFGASTDFTEYGTRYTLNQPQKNIYELNLNGPIIKDKLSFTLSGEINDQNEGFYMNQQSLNQSYQGKITYNLSAKHKLAIGGLINRSEWDQFYFPASKYGPGPNYQEDQYLKEVLNDTLIRYQYVDDEDLYGETRVEDKTGSFESTAYNHIKTYYMAGMQEYLWTRRQDSNMGYLLWTHTLSNRTYYEVRFNSFYSNYHYATKDVDDRDGDGNHEEDLEWDPSVSDAAHPITLEQADNYWWVRGDDPAYRDQKSWTNSLKADLVSQITSNHLLKSGIELNYHHTDVENITWSLGYGQFRKDIWDQNSFDFAAYIQDKLEFEGIIALVGLRLDAFDPTGLGDPLYYPADYNSPFTELDEEGVPIFINPKKAETKVQFSPRLGISHPITDKSVLHFTYGHYFQRPDGYYLFRNHKIQSLTKVGNYVGNPNLQPEKTVAYEVGIEQEFPYLIKGSMTGFYKDVTNLLNWEKYVAYSIGGNELNVFTNADYGNIKGLEFSITKRPGKFFGGNINYTYSIAKGRSSDPFGGSGFYDSAKRMNILDFDQTHTINANLTISTPDDFGYRYAGLRPFELWTANVQFNYGSGLPYSAYGSTIVNGERLPWRSTTDVKIMKQFKYERYRVNLFADIFNLFDRRNVQTIGNTYYYEYGAEQDDESVKGDPAVVRRNSDGTFARNPQVYSLGRHIRFGVGINF